MTDLALVELAHEGAALEGRLAMPAGAGPHPAVLVMHSAHGLSDHDRGAARRLAERGYAALATDMYGGGAHAETMVETGKLAGPLFEDPPLIRRRAIAWFERLSTLPAVDPARVAAIGYCFGGQCVLELARSGADARLVVSYHGLLKTHAPAPPGAVKAHVAVFNGDQDSYAPPEDVAAFQDEMRAAGAHWQLTNYGDALHGFTMEAAAGFGTPGVGYDALSDALSWAATLALLDRLV